MFPGALSPRKKSLVRLRADRDDVKADSKDNNS
jgi:hypothetical protein